jgi:hypothetical protein
MIQKPLRETGAAFLFPVAMLDTARVFWKTLGA